jgi:hypothetical protein
MARLTRQLAGVPGDLHTYVPKRWIRQALEDPQSPIHSLRFQSLSHAEQLCDPFAVIIYAPPLYRAALRAAVGERDGDRYFQAEMKSPRVQKMQVAAIARTLSSQQKVA